MTFINKLIRTDSIFMLTLISVFITMHSDWRVGRTGFAMALFIISVLNHFKHFRTFKKFYQIKCIQF